jgi:CheY-like chemotaxis protein
MTNRKILIVDDDSELREALVEQLALHEEFEPIAVDNGTKGVQTAKAGQIDLVIAEIYIVHRIRDRRVEFDPQIAVAQLRAGIVGRSHITGFG